VFEGATEERACDFLAAALGVAAIGLELGDALGATLEVRLFGLGAFVRLDLELGAPLGGVDLLGLELGLADLLFLRLDGPVVSPVSKIISPVKNRKKSGLADQTGLT
jgi:hypothetical protein